MKQLKKFAVLMMICASVLMTGCDASQIMETISKVAEGIQNAIPAIRDVVNSFSSAFSNNNNDNTQTDSVSTSTSTSNIAENDEDEDNASTIVLDPTDKEDLDDNKDETSTSTATSTDVSKATISEKGQSQMKSVVDYALYNHQGGSDGKCFNAVWGYLTSSGYGKLDQWGDLPNMGSGEAKDFANYLNSSKANLEEAGLQRLDIAFDPPITNPHDPRIPQGAVIVVAAGSTGTSHDTAGDIVIKGNGRFINDGPNMDYGTKDTWKGKVLGVYAPK